MTTIGFRTAVVTLHDDCIVSIFNDGKINEFYYDGKDEDYKDIVRMYGYGDDWRRYALEHELAHHFIADNMAWQYSWSLHSSAGRVPGSFSTTWPDHIGWEERIVNQFQLYCQTGKGDPLNVLHCALRNDLEQLAWDFMTLMNKIEVGHERITYDHNTGRIWVSTGEDYEPTANILHPA